MPLIIDGDIRRGFIRERKLLSIILPEKKENTIPEMAYSYAKGISEITGIPLKDVLNSKPVKSYISRIRKEVRL